MSKCNGLSVSDISVCLDVDTLSFDNSQCREYTQWLDMHLTHFRSDIGGILEEHVKPKHVVTDLS